MVQIHPPLPNKMIREDISKLLAPLIQNCGCELWGVSFLNNSGKGRILRIYIDAIQGVNIKDCENVSKEIDFLFQENEVFYDFNSFEVSSPGIDRTLFDIKQYKNFVGDVVSLTLFSKVNGKRKIKGTLIDVLDERLCVRIEKEELLIDFVNIEKGKLDLEDQLNKKNG